MSSPRQPAVAFIFVNLALAIVGFGLLIPVLPKLIVEFQGGDLTNGSRDDGFRPKRQEQLLRSHPA